MSQLPLFDEPVVAISISAVYDDLEGWRVVVVGRRLGHSFRDSDPARYEGIASAELADLIFSEVWTQLRIA